MDIVYASTREMTAAFIKKLMSSIVEPGGFSEPEQALLEATCNEIMSFPARRDMIRECDRPHDVHVIIEGWACRYKVLRGGTRQITAFLLPGDMCDPQIAQLDRMDHSIGALTNCRVALISPEKMAQLSAQPRLASALLWATLVDEAILRAWIVNMGRREAFVRVGHLICELNARLGNVGLAQNGVFLLPLTQEMIADALGLTSVHVNRTFRRLRTEELLTFHNQQVAILDVRKLQQLVDFDPTYLHLLPRDPDHTLSS